MQEIQIVTYISNSPSHHSITFWEGKNIYYVVSLQTGVLPPIIHKIPKGKYESSYIHYEVSLLHTMQLTNQSKYTAEIEVYYKPTTEKKIFIATENTTNNDQQFRVYSRISLQSIV